MAEKPRAANSGAVCLSGYGFFGMINERPPSPVVGQGGPRLWIGRAIPGLRFGKRWNSGAALARKRIRPPENRHPPRVQLNVRLKFRRTPSERASAISVIGLGRKGFLADVPRHRKPPTDHHPGLVSQALSPANSMARRRVRGPGQTHRIKREGRAADHSHGQAREPDWAYYRIAGALAPISGTMIFGSNGRQCPWQRQRACRRRRSRKRTTHMGRPLFEPNLGRWQGTDFFPPPRCDACAGCVTYYVLFLHPFARSRRVYIAGFHGSPRRS